MADTIVTLLGVRGTIPVDGPEVALYGGGTSCVLVRIGGETIVFDAGTGLMTLGQHLHLSETGLHLLLSHPHFDHLAGLPACPVLLDPTRTVTIYAMPRAGLSAREQVETLMAPPLWPVGPEAFRAAVSFRDLDHSSFSIGAVQVDTMEGCHPGGCTVFRLSYGGKSVVYATDFELDAQSAQNLCAFAQGCSLLMCDGQYSEEQAVVRRGFGHSAWRMAAQVSRDCAAERLLLIHHDPARTDTELAAMEPLLRKLVPNSAFARRGEELRL